jgi:hypothetical protein
MVVTHAAFHKNDVDRKGRKKPAVSASNIPSQKIPSIKPASLVQADLLW